MTFCTTPYIYKHTKPYSRFVNLLIIVLFYVIWIYPYLSRTSFWCYYSHTQKYREVLQTLPETGVDTVSLLRRNTCSVLLFTRRLPGTDPGVGRWVICNLYFKEKKFPVYQYGWSEPAILRIYSFVEYLQFREMFVIPLFVSEILMRFHLPCSQ